MHYVINSDNYYLVIDPSIDISELVGCEICVSLTDLYTRAAARLDLDLEEVEHGEIYIQLEDGHYIEYDTRGIGSDIETDDIARYVSEWQC